VVEKTVHCTKSCHQLQEIIKTIHALSNIFLTDGAGFTRLKTYSARNKAEKHRTTTQKMAARTNITF